MGEESFWYRGNRKVRRKSVNLPALLTSTLTFYLLFLAMPLFAQDGPDLTSALIDQRIAALREEGVADADEPLKTYRSVDLWLSSTHMMVCKVSGLFLSRVVCRPVSALLLSGLLIPAQAAAAR